MRTHTRALMCRVFSSLKLVLKAVATVKNLSLKLTLPRMIKHKATWKPAGGLGVVADLCSWPTCLNGCYHLPEGWRAGQQVAVHFHLAGITALMSLWSILTHGQLAICAEQSLLGWKRVLNNGDCRTSCLTPGCADRPRPSRMLVSRLQRSLRGGLGSPPELQLLFLQIYNYLGKTTWKHIS